MKRKIFVTGLTLALLLSSCPLPIYAVEKSQEDVIAETLESTFATNDSTMDSIVDETSDSKSILEATDLSEKESTFDTEETSESSENTEIIEDSTIEETVDSEELVEADKVELQYFDDNFVYPSNRSDLTAGQLQVGSPSVNVESNTPKKDFIDIFEKHGKLSVADFEQMKAHGIIGVVVKLTESVSYSNPYASVQIKNALEAGLKVSVSHYSTFSNESTAKQEAEYFSNAIGGLNLPKDTVLINDIEKLNEEQNQTANSKAFAARLNELGFSNINHYVSGEWIKKELIDPNELGKNKIWLAAYPYEISENQQYTEYAAWQWSNQMIFPNIEGTFAVSSNYIDSGSQQQAKVSTFASTFSNINQNVGKYVTIESNISLWQINDKEAKQDGDTSGVIGQTLQIKKEIKDSKNTSYYLLTNNKNNEIGYVKGNDVKVTTSQGGVHQSYGKFVTISSPNYEIWQNFNWKQKDHSSNYNVQTLEARGYYNHFNGSRYLSLYNNKGKWIGYINEKGTELGKNSGGAHQSYGKYVTINSPSYKIWQNFNWKQLGHSSSYMNQTFEARGYYNHFNGSRYLSLYNNKGKWIGYINEKGTELGKNSGGAHQSFGKYVTINSPSYKIWQNFNWKQLGHSSSYIGQMFEARGYYNHFNGSRYLSLYNSKGKWIGYINEKGTKLEKNAGGEYKSFDDYITVVSGNYKIWQNFSWKQKDHSSKHLGSYLEARGYYDHFNGSRYLSLYSSSGKWIGYINENGTNIKKLYEVEQKFDSSYSGKPVHIFVMGHGAGDPGAVGSGTNEGDFTRNELLPLLRKYASKLKNNRVEFYDPSRNMYDDSRLLYTGAKTLSRRTASVTEIHLDAAIGASGGHVIVNTKNGNTAENRAFVETLRKYSSVWGGVSRTNGLSYRSDLLNLNVLGRRNVPYRLVELGFITNYLDVVRLRTNLDALAKSMIESATGEIIN